MPKTSLKSKSVYIGNAPYTTTEADLHEMFSNVGECSIRFPPTEHSRVIAFADYGTHEEAVRAAVKFHDTLMGDRGLRCHVAVPTTWDCAAEWYASRPWGRSTSKCVYIGNCAYDTCTEDVHRLFLQVGECTIHSVFRLPRGVAFVQYGSHEDALLAVKGFHESLFNGRYLRCHLAEKGFHQNSVGKAPKGIDSQRTRLGDEMPTAKVRRRQ